jgi:GNAT superfamily N-acetyltransferase/exonuclease VII small subunit
MNNYSPRLLIRAFTVLQEELDHLNQASSDTLKQAEYTQACAHERVAQALRWSAIASNQVKSDLEDVEEIEVEVNNILSQCGMAVDIAHETVSAIGQATQEAEVTLRHWQAELQLALAWQARAEERLEKAIQIFKQAQRSCESAKRDLSNAESSLEGCVRDPERRSCDSENRRYNSAREELSRAIKTLKIAEIEVQAAQEELEEAKERVRGCREAVSLAEQAVQHSYAAKEKAEQALNDAERSLENADAANRTANTAQFKTTEAEEYIEQLIIKVNQAERITNEAQIHTQTARRMSDSAYRLAVMGKQELRYRVDCLIHLDQPSLDNGQIERSVSNNEVEALSSQPINSPISPISSDSEFSAKDLVYEYYYLDSRDSGRTRIEAKNFIGQEVGFMNLEQISDSRVRIKDTFVSEALRRKGIGPELLRQLEDRFPSGTELFFEENQAVGFWEKNGFQEKNALDGKKYYSKMIQK